jgi:glycosyltransferase involved in cell wall biosynthesis
MKIVSFINNLTLGGTEKAACRWAWGLMERKHEVTVIALQDGPRRADLEQRGVPLRLVEPSAKAVADALREIRPDVIHAHAPGHSHVGDVLGDALELFGKIPVVQTNIFGHLYNPKEDAWTNIRLFISWTSCVQAARRVFRRLDANFFASASVAVYPIDAHEPTSELETSKFRSKLGVNDGEVLFGRLSRPEPNKWTDLPIDAFRLALHRNRKMKLLLREPPPLVAKQLEQGPDADHFIILPATADPDELRLTMSALDVVLHTSSIGESFGYGIAEPMNLGKPVITHSVPWADQAQIELVRHGECGFVTSTPVTMADAIENLASNAPLRAQMGAAARSHVRSVGDPAVSIVRVEAALQSAVEGRANSFAAEDFERARRAAAYLDAQQFGHSFREALVLWPTYLRVRFFQLRNALRSRFLGTQ